jgi:hypothetical protein
MKKSLLLFVIIAFTFMGVNAQTPWNLEGNSDATATSFIGTTVQQPLIFKTNGIERMQLLPDKPFLGVGTSNPQASLHLYFQDGGLYPPVSQNLLQLTTPTSPTGFSIISNRDTKDLLFKQQEAANFKIEGQNGGFVIAKDGNIGFGTDEPQEKVHVEGKLLIERTETTASSLQFKHPKNTRDVGPGNDTVFLAPHLWDIYSDYTGLKINTVGENGTKLTQRMFISSTGSVGIGMATPQARLHVGQNILAEGNITTRDKFALAPDNTGRDCWEISRTTTGLNYAYKDNSPLDILFLSNDGKIGIGKTDPQTTLDVNGSATVTDLKANNATITGNTNLSGKLGIGVTGTLRTNLQIGDIWTFQNVSASNNIGRNTYFNSTNDVRMQTGFASRIAFNDSGDILLQTAPQENAGSTIPRWNTVTFANNGDVKIGTLGAQTANLEVNGIIKAESANITGTLFAKSAHILDTISTKLLIAKKANMDTITGKILTIPKARITEMLCANEIKVQLTNCWPDYVFGKDYNLLPLNEVEQFITENQHLPNVPSAAEVEANGINIGEMNAILLQKVEEMTLYIIQMEKRLYELENVKGGR